MFKKRSLKTFIIIFIMMISMMVAVPPGWTDVEEEEPAGDESALFISIAPDVLILLDLSGSMNFNPAGKENYIYGSSLSCLADTNNCAAHAAPAPPPVWGGWWWGWHHHDPPPPGGGGVPPGGAVDCSDGFCKNPITDCNIDCSRLAIAKRALFNVLDDDNNNTINSSDSASLGVRVGFMRFKGGNDTAGDYTKGNNRLITAISVLGKETGTAYSTTFCGNSTSCSQTYATSCGYGTESLYCESATSGTPLSSGLKEAKLYLDAHKAKDTSKDCRQKFVLAITDGADTYACTGDGSECQEHMYKRRREVVAATRAMANAGYKTFVVGFGAGLTSYLKNTLEWAAYYGDTDNAEAANPPEATLTAALTAYNIPAGSAYPSGIVSCSADAVNETATCYSAGSTSNTDHFKATANDPGYVDLYGYAFFADNADALTSSLKSAFSAISSSTYAFTQSSIQAVRTKDENYVYEASFSPSSTDPFWIGHLKRFDIAEDGTIATTTTWDAGAVLQSTSEANRHIYTLDSSTSPYTLKEFTAANFSTSAYFNVSTDAERTAIINFIRGGELDSLHANYGWKLGDIFHTSPMSIATPNPYFVDNIDESTIKAFDTYRGAHERTSENGKRLILVGANDGQLHSFKAGALAAGGGQELWSFIPPNLLSKFKYMTHSAHPTKLTHEYFVDGPISAAEIWIGANQAAKGCDVTDPTSCEWKTYMVVGEGRGGLTTLWSANSSTTPCFSDFSTSYKNYNSSGGFVPFGQYCGYYAFDISDTTSLPVFKWRLGGSSPISTTADGIANYLGQPWSKMFMGRVKIAGVETWVGLIGGGYSGNDCSGGGTCDTRGKGFFVVKLSDGSILWSFTRAQNSDMDYDLVAGPAAADSDGDGYIDTAYIGDVGQNIWRFKFCTQNQGNTCGTASWTGNLLLDNH